MASSNLAPVDPLIGQPIDKLITKPSTAAPVATSTSQQLGEDAFLKLLTTELKNQDPLKPMDNTASIAQLAHFSALQSQNELKSSFETFQQNFGVTQAANMIGKSVTVQDPNATGAGDKGSNITGKISGITVQKSIPYFTLTDSSGAPILDSKQQPTLFATSQILGLTP